MNFDDQPVGLHSIVEIPELPPEAVSPVASGPLEERLKSKNPKVRFEAFIELEKKFEEAPEGDPIWESHYDSFPKYISDAHPGSQEKALESFLLLLAKAPPKVDSILSTILASIFEKGCTSSKTNTKAKAFECLETISEMEGTQESIRELIQGYLSAKGTHPKIIIATLQASTYLLNVFGNLVFPTKNMLPLVQNQASSTNAGIKGEAMNYFKEAHRWEKAELQPFIDKLKQAQIDEFKKSICDSAEVPVPKKTIKGAIVIVNKMEDILLNKPKCKKPDYDSAKEVSILKKFSEAWGNSVLECKKWSEKRDKLEELVQASNVEKIKSENLGDLVSSFKLLLNDSNVVVNNQTIKIIGQLAKGLRFHYSTQSKLFYRIIVEKLRNKKTFTEAQKCLEYFALSIKPEEIVEEIKEALGDRTTQVRICICALLEKNIFPSAKKETVKSVSTAIIPILLKLSDDPASDVRDAALSVIGVIKTKIDDANLNQTISQMNSQKQEKIAKAAEQQKEEIEMGKSPRIEEVKVVTMEEEPVQEIPIQSISEPMKDDVEETKMVPVTNSPKAVNPNPLLSLPPPPIKKKPKKEEPKKEKSKLKEIKEEEIGDLMSLEQALAKIGECVPTEIREGLTDFL